MPAPSSYQCCEMCHRTAEDLSRLMDNAEIVGKFSRLGPGGYEITPEQEEKLRARFEIKRVLLDDNMETEMCGFCIRVAKKEMTVEVLD